MFKITPVQDLNLAADYCRACGVTPNVGAFVYAMCDCETGELMGISQFEILDNYGCIYSLCSVPGLDDFEAMFILGRQTMNFINMCGMQICRAEAQGNDASLLRAIGFKENCGTLECDMTGMFDGSHCSGGH
jgi:hypothetical protein